MRTLIPLLVALAVAAPAAAEETCYTTSTTGDDQVVVEIPVGAAGTGPRLYIVNDLCQDDPPSPEPYRGPCLLSLWDYEEANGIPGLQRQDARHSDIAGCGDHVTGDILFLY